MTISFKVSEPTINKLNEFYSDLKRPKTPPYAVFQADDGDTVVTLYESGKIVFQGKDADLASDFWVATEKMNNKKLEVNNSDNKKEKKIEIDPKIYYATTIGSDEVGTGDYFGPIVVTSTYVQKEDIPFLEKLGVKDSKKIDDNKIIKIIPEILKKIPYKTYILTNKEYNKMQKKGYNMNKIKSILHNKVLSELTNEYKSDYIVVDEFTPASYYYNYLKESPNICKGITFMTKGETKCLSVACASIISRYIFLEEMNKLSKNLKIELPKGASLTVDEIGKQIVQQYGIEKLNDIAKINFKNTEKIKEKL